MARLIIGIAPAQSKNMNEKILLVDDNPRIRTDIALFLRTEGYEVNEAGNGNEALQALEKADYDLVLSDVLMPKLDGFGLLESMRSLLSDVPVLLMSGVRGIDAKEAIERGATDLIVKPFEFKELLSKVKMALYR
jgi:DNA-binding response OmpR family regulator